MNDLRRRWVAARSSATLRVWLLTGGLAGAAAILSVRLAGFGPLFATPRLPWWGLAAIFLLAEAFPVHLHFRSETHTLSLSELGVVLGLFLASPDALVCGMALGSGLALVLVRRQRPLKVAFNVAEFALSVGTAVLAFRATARLGDAHGPVGWLAAATGAVAFGLVSVLLVTLAISLAARENRLADLPRTLGLALVGSLASASLAIIAVELIEADPRAIWLLVVPVIFWGFAFRAYGEQRRRHEHLEFLYQTMRATQTAPEFRVSVRELLVAARQLLSADYAEIVLLGSTQEEGALHSVISGGSEKLLEASTPTLNTESAIRIAAERERAILLPRGGQRHDLTPFAAERGLKDALLVGLRREQRPAALLVVGNRVGEVSTFKDDDRELFETFAAHASVLLENDQVKDQLRYQAYHDALTGLPNRSLFTERVSEALARGSEDTSILFVDLDDFKTINDTLGHSAGDDLLAAVAERVRASVDTNALAARLGGDEFGILIGRDPDSEPQAEQTAARLVDALRVPFVLHGREVQVRASIGIAEQCSSGARSADDLLSKADVAMYNAKADGKQRYAVFEPRMHMRVRRRHELGMALEQALDRDEITVHYQPIISLADTRTVAFEALVRWRHPTRGLLLPGNFIPLAEEMHLMVRIGQTVLRQACAQVREWHRAYPAHGSLGITVNLSPAELQNPQLTREIEAILDQTQLPPDKLILEITESGAIADPASTLLTMHDLNRLGVRLALDDFGTGFSSLSHLRDFPIDMLKLAKPFVDRLERDQGDVTFTDAILRLAAALQLTVVAEGIERPEQARVLRDLECGLAQGYHFSRPMDAENAERHLVEAPARRVARIRAA
jgi:diguanylate cyclase (GGDEF)-like protein